MNESLMYREDSRPMTEHMLTPTELEELAVLDAWGLLTGDELAEFEAVFAICDAAQRAHLRSIQEASTADLAAGWADAPGHLRDRVLQRVQATMDLNMLRLAAVGQQPAAAPRASFLGSAWTWRMAAMVLLAVSVTLVVMHQATRAQYDTLLSEHTVLQALRTMQADISPGEQSQFIAMMRRPDVRHMYVTCTDGPGMVRVAVDERTGDAFVLSMDLSGRTSPCDLELVAASGEVVSLATLRTDRHFDAARLKFDVAVLDGATLQLRSGDGDVIGTTLV